MAPLPWIANIHLRLAVIQIRSMYGRAHLHWTGEPEMKHWLQTRGCFAGRGPREEQRMSGHLVTPWFMSAENICAVLWLSLVSDLGTFPWLRNLKAPGRQHL